MPGNTSLPPREPDPDRPDKGNAEPGASPSVSSTQPSCADVDLTLARVDVAKFVRRTARAVAAELGFAWVGSSLAPQTYQQLRGDYAASQLTGLPLPVSAQGGHRSSLYLKPEDALAFRFWQATAHVRLGLSFALPDELELAVWQLHQAEQGGLLHGSLPYRLLDADLLGRLLLRAIAGRPPLAEEAFVLTCAREGLGVGLLAELRRVPGINQRSTRLVGTGQLLDRDQA